MNQVENQDLGVDDEEVYEVSEHVLVFYGKLLFDATILEIDYKDDDPYLVHFHGWNKRYDLWVPLTHMVKLTEDTRNQQMELQALFEQEQDTKKSEKQKRLEARREAKKEERKEKIKKNITNRASKAVAPQRPTKVVPALIEVLLERILGAKEKKVYATARTIESQAHECCHNFSSKKNGDISKANMKSILSVLNKTEKSNLDKVWSVLAGSSGSKSINASHFVDVFKQQQSEDKKNSKVDTTQKKKQKKQARRRKKGGIEKEKEETKQERDRGRNNKRTRTQTRNNNEQTDVKSKKAHAVKKRKSRSGEFRKVASWFTSHELKGIRAIAQEVSSLDLEAILEVEKADWQSMTKNLLAGSAIWTFLKQFK